MREHGRNTSGGVEVSDSEITLEGQLGESVVQFSIIFAGLNKEVAEKGKKENERCEQISQLMKHVSE